MRRRRKLLPILFGFLLFAAAITLAVVLRKHAPPEPARLLPGADGYLYVNLKWIRRAKIAGQMPAGMHTLEYTMRVEGPGKAPAMPLDAHDVATLMEGMKIARRYTGVFNPDDYVDGAGYAACAGEIAAGMQKQYT